MTTRLCCTVQPWEVPKWFELLLEKPDPNVLDRDKKTALHIAAEKGYTLVVELLLEKAEPNTQDFVGEQHCIWRPRTCMRRL